MTWTWTVKVVVLAALAGSVLRAQPASAQGFGAAGPASAQGFGAAGPPADLVLTNGKIITVDDRFSIAQAVAVRGRSNRGGRDQSGDRAPRGSEHAADRSGRTLRCPGPHRQPRALHGRRRPLDRRAAPRRDRHAQAGDRDDAREGQFAPAGPVGVHARRLVARSVHRRQAVVLARRARQDRAEPPGPPAVHALGNVREQPRDRGHRSREDDRSLDQARRERTIDGRRRRGRRRARVQRRFRSRRWRRSNATAWR